LLEQFVFAGYAAVIVAMRWRAIGKLNQMTNPEDRDAGSDEPVGGPVDRPAGTVDEDANPPLSDSEDDTEHGGTGTLPPKDTEPAVPPYEGRT
jgi:hypothetical protein